MANQMDNEQLEFDLGEGEKAATVTFENDADGNEEQGKVQAPEREVPEQKESSAHSDELGSVNEAVQKRIAKLTAKMREAERREQAAVEYARGLQSQTQNLQQRLVHTDYSRLNEAKSRLDTQQFQLRQIIKKAREEGDIDTETEASQRLTDLTMEQRQVSGWLQQQEQAVRNPAPQQQYQPAAPKPATPDPRAEDWASRNTWFGQDRMLTYAAWGIHQELIEKEGVDPQSDEYYTELDRRLRDEFPKKFAGEQSSNQSSRQQRSAPAVAPASRSSGINSARRTVRLSPSQVAIAKKLGVPLEEYAKYVKE
jgi:hypothetical protein